VIFSRGDESAPIRVIPGRTPTTVETAGDTKVSMRSFVRDYLVLPEDLVLNDEQVWPKAGDEFIEDDAIYEIVRDLNGEPAWVWHDQLKEVMRVHTQLAAGT
jgi:hypothetical protein